MSDNWMSIVEYARANAISDMTVRRRIKNGKLKAELRDGKYFIEASAKGEGKPPVSEHKNEASAPTSYPSVKVTATPDQNIGSRDRTYSQGAIYSKERWNHDHDVKSIDAEFKNPVRSGRQYQYNKEDLDYFKGEVQNLSEKISEILRSQAEKEAYLKGMYTNKIKALESNLIQKEQVIRDLRQKTEDLQILIKMYDAKIR